MFLCIPDFLQVRPTVPTAKPGNIRAQSSAAKRPQPATNQTKTTSSVDLIDLTDDDDSNKNTPSKNKAPPPLNPVRGSAVTQPPRPSQNTMAAKSPPVAHRTPPRMPPGGKPSPNVVQQRAKPAQPQQQVVSQGSRQVVQQQQQQVQILQTVQRQPQTLQQRQVQQPQRSIATQQVSPNMQVVSQQARVQPMQSRAVTVTTCGTRQIVSIPANQQIATTATLRGVAPQQILQQAGQQVVQAGQQVVQQVQQHQVLQQQVVQQQVVQPGQAARIIQTPVGQVVMTPMSSMASGMTTVLAAAAQPIQGQQAGQLTQYQIQALPSQTIQGNATVQQMLLQQQQQQQQQTAQVVQQQQQQQVATRFAAPANSAAPNVQQVSLSQSIRCRHFHAIVKEMFVCFCFLQYVKLCIPLSICGGTEKDRIYIY